MYALSFFAKKFVLFYMPFLLTIPLIAHTKFLTRDVRAYIPVAYTLICHTLRQQKKQGHWPFSFRLK